MATKRTKKEAMPMRVPQSQDEAVEFLSAIGRGQRERERIQASMNDELSAIRTKYESQALPHTQDIRLRLEGLHVWAEAHKDALTEGGKTKTASLASGEIKWRLRPKSVNVSKIETVLESLKLLKLTRFIRTKEEIDKEKILKEPEAVAGVVGLKISQTEDFVVEPFEMKLEEVL
jgi:phage host-nuclease inhibitor protein Gam